MTYLVHKRVNQNFLSYRYALANLLLIIGAKKEIKLLVLLWIVFTVGFLIW